MPTALLAAFLFHRQNPNPPFVALPSGWRVDYQRPQPGQLASLIGPKGEAIAFPAYGECLESAPKIFERDPQAFGVKDVFEGRHVAAALTSDGTLTVSLGERKPHEHASDSSVDFVTKASTARQTAVALMIVMSRLTEPDRDPLTAGSLRSPHALKPRTDITIDGPTDPGSLKIELLPLGPLPRGFKPGGRPRGASWVESMPILRGTLTVSGTKGKNVVAEFLPDHPAPGAHRLGVSVATETPRAAMDAVFAALMFSHPKA